MAQTRRIVISQVVGSSICVASDDGHKVYDRVAESLQSQIPVVLSFQGVTRLTTAFLNAAVGQLYNEFSDAFIREHLSFEDIDNMSLDLLRRVVQRAKLYFRDMERNRRVVEEVTEGEGD
jgi:hypothetical protein